MPKLVEPTSVAAQAVVVTKPAALPEVVLKEEVVERKIVYPKVCVIVDGKQVPITDFAITYPMARKLLGYETETEFAARQVAKHPELKEEQIKFGKDYQFINCRGEKVRCKYNKHNRELRPNDVKKLAQTILKRNWAGPTTMPGETVNGETMVFGRTGEAQQAQHRLLALCDAYMMWEDDKTGRWKALWPKSGPLIETIVIFGVSESEKVRQTYDTGAPRTLTDTYFSDPMFADMQVSERKELARMMDKALDWLWKRTGAGDPESKTPTYQTHIESHAFGERHPKLKDCLFHLFTKNKERGISALRLSPGECSAMMYVMAVSGSDMNVYRSPTFPNMPHEGLLDFGYFEQAGNFFVELVKDTPKLGRPVKEALALLVDADIGSGGRANEKEAILAKAWRLYREGEPVRPTPPGTGKTPSPDLDLEYKIDQNGAYILAEWPDFGGIDLGPKKVMVKSEDSEIVPTEEEIAAAAEQEKQENVEEERAKEEAKTAKPVNKFDQLAAQAAAKTKISTTPTAPSKTQPLVPKKLLRPDTSKQVQAQQTAKATANDAKPKEPQPVFKQPGTVNVGKKK